ncbi:MULE domain-containing protein, partial [Aphis craccivora]
MIDFEKAVQKSVNEVFPECLNLLYVEIRKIAALAFIPEEAVENAFKTLIESTFYENNEPELAPLLNYFEDTWLDLPRTNNGVEGWHNTLYSILHAAHPSN